MLDPCCSGTDAHTGVSRRHLIVASTAAGGLLALRGLPAGGADSAAVAVHPEGSSRDYGFDPPRPADEVHLRRIMFPVVGPVSWSDTYLFPRGGGRRHEGQDLMAAKMQKLVACVSGTIVELRHGGRGGSNSLYLKGDDGWYYAYLHINNDTPGTDDGANRFEHAFAPGMATGVRVRKGDHIAYVGDSGNAEGSGSHCHFEIRMPKEKWYNAAAVNPEPSLLAAEDAHVGPRVPPETFVPWDNSADLVRRQYRDFFGRTASAASIAYWGEKLDAGGTNPTAMIHYFIESQECDDKTQSVARLYEAAFLRRPDFDGFWYWADRRRRGLSITGIADYFATSSEFVNRYGALDDRDYIARIYQNVLHREPDAGGLDFWLGELARGISRGKMLAQFSNSTENRDRQRFAMHVIGTHGCMLRRMPTSDELATWTGLFEAETATVADMVAMIRVTPEYKMVVNGTT
jgi:hypothetical protein